VAAKGKWCLREGGVNGKNIKGRNMKGFLVLENGEIYQGNWQGGKDSAGEVVFNTSHNGYEEIATDFFYFGQIMVMSAPQQGNYGIDKSFWESRQLWIRGFIALEIQRSEANTYWLNRLEDFAIPSIDSFDTRELVLSLRESGTQVGAMVQAEDEAKAREKASPLISQFKEINKDWVYEVSCKTPQKIQGANGTGPKIAVLDYGCKENILRELIKRSRELMIFPSRTSAKEILNWKPDGILLSNGPGDPEAVKEAVETIKELIGQKTIFGICMGHQLLARALGASTFKLKFGHRGANHPVKNIVTGEIFVTSQNHGYAVKDGQFQDNIQVTHTNLNDNTISGIESSELNCFSVQFHPESHPGPRDAEKLFDQFIDWIQR
jgi:carbamoyl-phosphate synthase small subunit